MDGIAKRWGLEWVIDECWNCEHQIDQDMEADYLDDDVVVIWECSECLTENEYRRYVGDV